MKGRIRIIGIVLAVGLLGWLIVAVVGQIEPRYQGRTLTHWIDDAQTAIRYCPDPEHPESEPAWRASQAAVKTMGKKTLPFLLRWTQAKDSPLKMKVIRLLRTKSWVHLDLRDPALRRHLSAMFGFLLLGSDARSAMPALIAMTKDEDREHRFWGFYCLAVTRPDRETLVPVAVRLLRDPDAQIKEDAAQTLFGLYPQEAKKLGVCEMFPELCNPPTNVVIHTH